VKRVAVVGGGVAGLAAAYELSKLRSGGERLQVALYEASGRLGGIVETVREGGLISFGPLLSTHYALAADYVDKILKGAKPADLPVQQPTQFALVVNVRTAKSLGLTVPPSVLTRADEVIQ